MDAVALVIIVVSIGLPLLVVLWFLRSFGRTMGGFGGLMGSMGSIKNGVPGAAVIQSVSETGMTISSPSIGPEAAVYRLGLQVTPPGGVPYDTEVTHAIPRVFMPMTVPGARIGVLIDPANPQKVVPDFQRYMNPDGATGAGATVEAGQGAMMTAGGVMSTAGVNVTFDAQGHPTSGLDSLVGAVRSGQVPQIKGKAATLLATGTHGTAVVTSAQPLGMKVRDVDPNAEPSHLDDPMWLFTVEVTLAGRPPFTAMFGHRVPAAKVGQVAPGAKLAVAVDESNPSQECAIDWDRSPLA
jgi:hypothetical protein